MYYRSNQPPQTPPPPGSQRGYLQQQGARPADFQGRGYQPPHNGNPKKKHSFAWQLTRFLLVLVLVGAIGAGIYIGKAYLDVQPYTSVFLDGVSVDGIDLGGMTWEEGNAAVRNQITQELGSWYVRLKNANGAYPDITAESLNISRDPTAALEAAWAVGHETSAVNRKTIFALQKEIQEAKATTYSFSSVRYDADTSQIDGILSMLERAAYIAPQDAKMLSFNPDSSSAPFTYQAEVVGRKLNTEALKTLIMEMVTAFESGEILMQTEPIAPDITVADLGKYYALRGRAVTPIDTTSTDARNANIRIAFSKINGYILNNGAKFTFNGVVGKRSLENGFYHAYEYTYGELTIGVGGGVCQASTTVYLAAMQAGMDLIDHTPHAMKVSYTDLGMDATVTDTRGAEKDMSFRNNSGGQIFIAAHVIEDAGNKKRLLCEVRVYGMDLGDTTYKLEARTVQVLQPPTEPVYVPDVDAEHVTFTDETMDISAAAEGYVVDTYRNTFVNGVQTDSKKLTRSTYPARARKIWIGTTVR